MITTLRKIAHTSRLWLAQRPATADAPFSNLKVALIADELTRACLQFECHLVDITPSNYKAALATAQPDLLLVESAWHGFRNAWKYKIAAYPGHPLRTNKRLREVVAYARDRGIPCVFWNKEDGVHFERFIDSAALFDYIFTVDENCIARYQQLVGAHVKVNPLMFAVQPRIHYPAAQEIRFHRSCFVGSYSHHIHERRRAWQTMFFNAASELGVTAFDRNSSRFSRAYRYPKLPWLEVKNKVDHLDTARVYREYLVQLNVNKIEDSATMFSRRLIEVLACGSCVVTNPSVAVERLFSDYCEVVRSEEACREFFGRLKHGLAPSDKERALAGAAYVLREHTWRHRLEEILHVVG